MWLVFGVNGGGMRSLDDARDDKKEEGISPCAMLSRDDREERWMVV